MPRYRPRAVLLLFLLLNLTACQTWQSVSLDAISPAQLIEVLQPDRVRVTVRGGDQMELERPVVDGDELVGTARIRTGGRVVPSNSVSLADVLLLEIGKISSGRTIGAGFGLFTVIMLVYWAICGVEC